MSSLRRAQSIHHRSAAQLLVGSLAIASSLGSLSTIDHSPPRASARSGTAERKCHGVLKQCVLLTLTLLRNLIALKAPICCASSSMSARCLTARCGSIWICPKEKLYLLEDRGFCEKSLVAQLQAQRSAVGDNFRFGASAMASKCKCRRCSGMAQSESAAVAFVGS
jgi:hypothetical protein